jgi:hypothetical protein
MRWIGYALACVISIVSLGGCGGLSSVPIQPSVSAVRGDATSDLLYTAYLVSDNRLNTRSALSVSTFPEGKNVATIALRGVATGVCSDRSGDVWVVQENRDDHVAYEYVHGGTKPIAQIHVPYTRGFALGCAVDPTTGNLAVLVANGNGRGFVEVWAGARSSKPASFDVPFFPNACAYDANGNLFVDGSVGSTQIFSFGELLKGTSRVETVKLDRRPYNFPGGIAWDGTYVDLGDNDGAGYGKIYRIAVSSYEGHVVAIVHFARLNYAPMFAVRGGWLVGTSGGYAHEVSLWHFPAGGQRVKELERFAHPSNGVTISRGQ